MWLLGCGAVLAVLVFQESLNSSREAETLVGDLRQHLEQAPAIPFELASAAETPTAARLKLEAHHQRFHALVSELQRRDPDDRLDLIEALGERIYSVTGAALDLALAPGELELAQDVVFGLSSDGTRAELRTHLAEQRAALRADADRMRLLSELGSALAVLLTLVAFSLTLLRATRSKRRAERLALANERLLESSRKETERYLDLFENAHEPIATVDLDWNLTDVNQAFASALGYSRAKLLGSSLLDYLTEDGRTLASKYRGKKLDGLETASRYEQRFVSADGREVVFEVSTRLIEEHGKPVGIQGMCRDITARKEAEHRLRQMAELNRYQAHHDALTGLPNRLAFHDEIARAIAGGSRRGPFAVVLIDLDRFKQINDSLGHRAGDVLLQQLAVHLQEVVLVPDVVARLGGDEFGVLLHGLSSSRAGWADAVERIKAALDQPQLVDGVPVMVEASIGIAIHPTHGQVVDDLVRRAEVAMYVAKTSGRGHAVYSPGEDVNDAGKLALLGELRRAISERELVLYFQPIVDQRTNRSTKVEALLRWEHPTHGLIAPSEFVPLAETSGLIRPLTLYVLDEAARQCKEWEDDGRVLDLSINLSTRNLSEPDLVENVLGILARRGLDPSRVTLEITESAVMADPDGTKRVLERLRSVGIQVAVDDFGAGFTSLSHLAHFPIDEIKIDRSFVQRLLSDAHDRAIVRSIIGLSHDLDLRVVAEGVETWDVLADLRGLGCDLVQGFFFSRPLPGDEVSQWLAREAGERHAEQAA
jgi:diguanylate cyclase (GGDEF)-like protein/PAS domain S-box-containing protein